MHASTHSCALVVYGTWTSFSAGQYLQLEIRIMCTLSLHHTHTHSQVGNAFNKRVFSQHVLTDVCIYLFRFLFLLDGEGSWEARADIGHDIRANDHSGISLAFISYSEKRVCHKLGLM